MPKSSILNVSEIVKDGPDESTCIVMKFPVNRQFAVQLTEDESVTITVTEISMLVFPGDWADALQVHWDSSPFEDKQEPFGLLMHSPFTDDAVTKIMRAIYRYAAITEEVRALLIENGFSENAANKIGGSEWGMQSPGLATFDAYDVANELCVAYSMDTID